MAKTNAERQAAWRQRGEAEIKLRAQVRKLQAALAKATAAPTKLVAAPARTIEADRESAGAPLGTPGAGKCRTTALPPP